jgi:hypothetical protein
MLSPSVTQMYLAVLLSPFLVPFYCNELMMYRRGYVFAIVLAIIAVLVSFFPQQKQDAPGRKIVPGRNNTALFISNSEHGNSNVFLATAQALLLHHPDVEIHYATFAKRAKDIAFVNKFASQQSSNARSIIYHEITKGPSLENALKSRNYTITNTISAPGYRGSTQLCKDIQVYLSKQFLYELQNIVSS